MFGNDILKITTILLTMILSTSVYAQGVIDVHSHIITPEFVTSLESEGRLMDEGFPLPKYNVENHLKWMDEAGVETSVLTLAAQDDSCSVLHCLYLMSMPLFVRLFMHSTR